MKNLDHYKFTGREKEMLTIEQAIYKTGTTLIFIQAEGGIGKTRILREVKKKFDEFSSVKVSSIFDLFNIPISTPLSLEETIINDLNIKTNDYTDAYKDYLSISVTGVESITNKQIRKVQEEFVKILNKESKNRKIVIPIDTLDEPQVKESTLKYFISEVLCKLENVTVLLAGRESISELKNAFSLSKEQAIFINLEPLKAEESFNLLSDEISKDIKEKIFALTAGNPLLLSLSKLAYFKNKENLPEVLGKDLDEIKKDNEQFKKYKEQFEYELIKPFALYDDEIIPHSKYILQMAYCQKRYNAEIMSKLNDITIENANKILVELSDFFFIKPFDNTHFLQDAFRDLINKHYWTTADHPPFIRKAYFKELKSYYNEQIESFKAQIAELDKSDSNYETNVKKDQLQTNINQYEVELYFYQLTEEPEITAEQLAERLEDAIDDNRLIYAGMLEKVVSPQIENLNKSDAFFALKHQLGWYYKNIGNYDKAKEIFEQLTGEDVEQKKYLKEHYQAYGWILKETGKPNKAIEMFKKAIELAANDDIAKAWNNNNLAMVHMDEGYYGEAEKLFNESIEIAQLNGLEYEEALFSARIGRVHTLNAQYHEATNYFNDSIRYFGRKKDNKYIDEKNLNITKLYQAYMYGEMGNFGVAYSLFDEIKAYFKDRNDYYWLTVKEVYRSSAEYMDYMDPNLGTCLASHSPEDKLKFLDEALKYAEETDQNCLDFAQAYYPESLLITGLLQLEKAKFHAEKDNEKGIYDENLSAEFYEKSKKTIEKSFQEALNIHNLRIQAKSLAGLSLYYFYKEDLTNLLKVKKRIEGLPGIRESVLHAYFGEVYLFIGRLLFDNKKKYKEAFEYFRDCIGYLAEAGLYPTIRFPEFVEEILEKLLSVVKEDRSYATWLLTFKEEWRDKNENRIYEKEEKIIKRNILKYQNKFKSLKIEI